MKIATLYRKDGKVILETDNDAIAQVATDSPQDVVVMDARLVGRPPALAAPYGQVKPGRGPDQPGLCDLCRVREEVRSDAEGVPFCQERWDGWQAEEAKAVQP